MYAAVFLTLIDSGDHYMSIFDIITLLGGLAMFLFGMRLMGNGLKTSASGTLKVIMEKVTNNPVKAFFLGMVVTAIIQSSTATIVITSGLVGAGIVSLRGSLGIIIGANVGTTVTGQIIRLLDVDASGTAWLQFFKPSTLAPLALVAGIIIIMAFNFKNHETIGSIIIGFGILFSGLLNMTGAVSALNSTGMFDRMFSGLGENPLLGYFTGAGVAFALQSSSATVGILQAFATTGALPFKAIYAVIVGIYLGDCVTTFIVASIGAKPDAKRVGLINIMFNLSETVLVLLVVTIVHKLGIIDDLWNKTVSSGDIANTNTIFNLGCAVLLFPLIGVYEKIAKKIVRDEPVKQGKYDDKLAALSPLFFKTPAIAFRGCYEALLAMISASISNINISLKLVDEFEQEKFDEVMEEEENIDIMADRVSNYLAAFAAHVKAELHVEIFDQYVKTAVEVERLGDHAVNIANYSDKLKNHNKHFSKTALDELEVITELTNNILRLTEQAFKVRDIEAAEHIEPLVEVMDDMVGAMRDNHLARLRDGLCDVDAGTTFLDILTNLGRVADVCSNIGLAVVGRAVPDANEAHNYVAMLHDRKNRKYHKAYEDAREEYFIKLAAVNNR